jgi:hypothetical protein
MFATFTSKEKSQDPIIYTFKKFLSSADILSLKTLIESTYKVTFAVSGLEYDYDVTMTGSTGEFTRAFNTLFPKGREDIVVQRSQFV